MNVTILSICISILILQIIIEFLVVRNYALAAVFITILTIFLAEPNVDLVEEPNRLIAARFFDILIGSLIGVIGGWMLYHDRSIFSQKSR